MDFTQGEELDLLQATVERFVAKDYSFARRREIAASAAGWCREAWKELAQLGLLALNVPMEQGGLGGGGLATQVAMNALGPGLLLEPYVASGVVSTALLGALADSAAAAHWLPRMARGEAIVVLAHDEPGNASPRQIGTEARAAEDGYRLSGHKCVVAHAEAADALIVSARLSARTEFDGEAALFLVPRSVEGLRLTGCATLDGTRAADVSLQDVTISPAAVLSRGKPAEALLEDALDRGLAAHCAEAVGIMKATLDATTEYLRTRQQFGQAIGKFQALQHRAVDMLLAYEQAKSLTLLAALRCASPNRRERRRALAAAKLAVGRAARYLGQQAVQLHGGMGMSDELVLSHWFKRLTAIELTGGDSDTHLQLFIAASH